MTGKGSSRWADDEEDAALEAQKKKEKEEKKRAKAEKQRKQDEAAAIQRQKDEASAAAIKTEEQSDDAEISLRPAKRRRLSHDEHPQQDVLAPTKLLRFPAPEWKKCRSVENYDKLNDIEEGAYGWVSRAKDLSTGKVVALKRLKMDNATDGIPVTGLREIQTLMDCDHPNIVTLQEVVVGENTEKIENIFLVLDFLEHDLKTLLTSMPSPFLTSELKTLLHQLLSGLTYLHNNWILHRDLKTSNLLLSNRGILKIADFGMARYYGSPPPQMTQLVVTLWYRAPELLLGSSNYGPAIDLWSVGCIFAELVSNDPLFQGKNEVDQLTKIFSLCGIPTETTWPGYKRLPNARSLRLPPKSPIIASSAIRKKFPFLNSSGSNLLTGLLSLNPAERPSAQEALDHVFFKEDPKMKSTKLFPTFPSKAGLEQRRRARSPNAPVRGVAPELGGTMTMDFSGIFDGREEEAQGGGFALKLV